LEKPAFAGFSIRGRPQTFRPSNLAAKLRQPQRPLLRAQNSQLLRKGQEKAAARSVSRSKFAYAGAVTKRVNRI
jgi:hypothetical protein